LSTSNAEGMKRLTTFAFVLALVAGTLAAAPPVAAATIHVHNASGHCAYVTVYTGWGTTSWRAVSINDGGPRFLKPGIWWPFFLPADPNVRVRAEVLNGPECSGRTVADVFEVRTGLEKTGSYVAKVEKNGTGFRVVIYK
jgi:hypothetical protein